MEKIEAMKLPCVMVRYKCDTCGNTCLQDIRPDNSVCGGCNNPNWKIIKIQEPYMVDQKSWVHPNGEI